MALDWLKDPVSDDAPAGPDLEATDDNKFVDFYFEAEGLMPERYFVPGIASKDDEFSPGTLFDKKSVNLKENKPIIIDLLKRSRDLRLLSLLSRISVLGGDLAGFAEGLSGAADVLEAFPEDVNPRDHNDRRSALDDLGDPTVVVVPLQYIELAGSGEVSLRRYLVATEKANPREGEVGLVAGSLVSELGAPSSSKAVEAAHAALNDCAAAIARIKSACLRADQPFNPTLDDTVSTIREMQELIAMGRSDLQPWAAEEPAADPTPDDGDDTVAANDGDGDSPTPTAAPVAAAPTVVTKIPSRTAAVRTITAIETYFATHEPSSPALLLITQARLLVGKPLIEALETLLPADAGRAMIDFGPATGFQLDMGRLKMLAGEGGSAAGTIEDEDPGEDPVVANRADVAGHLSALEEFFRAREPASPIPVLLFKARQYLEKDFAAIVAELIPPQVEDQS